MNKSLSAVRYRQRLQLLATEIAAADADVVCLQEVRLDTAFSFAPYGAHHPPQS